jgi:hypothetical protein
MLFAGLVSFGIHSDLGRVVQAIKRELEKNPPIFPFRHQNPMTTPGGGPIRHPNLVNGGPTFQQQQHGPSNTPLYPLGQQVSFIFSSSFILNF